MKKVILLIVMLAITGTASAEWESGCSKDKRYAVKNPYMDRTGRVHSHVKIPQYLKDNGQFKEWTYLDENGYDYTVTIKVK